MPLLSSQFDGRIRCGVTRTLLNCADIPQIPSPRVRHEARANLVTCVFYCSAVMDALLQSPRFVVTSL